MEKRNQVKRVFFALLGAFLVVLLLRFAYVMFFAENDVVLTYGNSGYSAESVEKRNIATDRVKQQNAAGQEVLIDQKYDKTALLSLSTGDFDTTQQRLRDAAQGQEAIIQTEQLRGLAGDRTLYLAIGVFPDRFDALVAQVQTLGELHSFTVNKQDKTQEFRALMAEIETLEKTRESYAALKEQGGGIQDLLLLEEKLLDVERALQGVSVNAGLYATENSFCTVEVTLREDTSRTLSLRLVLSRLMDSFFWTVGAFALLLFLVLAGFCCAWALVWLNRRMKNPPPPRAQKRPSQTDGTEETREDSDEEK